MATEHWERVKEIVHRLGEADPAVRTELLESECGGDFGLRKEVESLLRFEATASGFLKTPNPDEVTVAFREHQIDALIGRTLGHFRITGVLGHGGMAVVYRATQEYPQREVALKVVRATAIMGTDRLRFLQREVRSLALLRHLGIAALYEAGTGDEGDHYFAMELIAGKPLTDFARDVNLSFPDRLRLFCRVCEAIHYAHQRGVIHRDLKPSNILVGEDGQPKVLDFGLAKITNADVSLTTLATEHGKIQGTLSYMSPEQARGAPDEIDIRSDVYSLGVVLYELLTGRLPYDVSHVLVSQAIDVICKEMPPKAGTIVALLRGDLETIIAKSLEKEPARRYPSAHALAEDIERFLNQQPITARPPSAIYQVRKLVARHRTFVALITALLLTICGFGAWMSFLYARSERNLGRAVQAEAQANEEAARANHEATRAKRTLNFLTDVFNVADPSSAHGRTITAREILDRGAERIRTQLAADAAAQAELLQVVGSVYENLGLDASAVSTYRSAVDVLETSTPSQPAPLELKLRIAACLDRLGEYGGAETLLRSLLEIRDDQKQLERRTIASADNLLGQVLFAQAKFPEAEERLQRALQYAQEAGDTSLGVNTLNSLGVCFIRQGRFAEARTFLNRALDQEPNNPKLLDNLAVVAAGLGEMKEAEQLYRRVIDAHRQALGEDHPEVARALANFALFVMDSLGDFGRAADLYRESLAIRRKQLGERHPDVADSLRGLADALNRLGEYASANQLFGESLAIEREVIGPRSCEAATTLHQWGECLSARGECELARPLLEEALSLRLELFGEQSQDTSNTMDTLARCVEPERATDLRNRAFAVGRETARDKPLTLARLLRNRGFYLKDENPREAISLLREAFEIQQKYLAQNPQIAGTMTMLAAVYMKQNELTEAEPLLREALQIRQNALAKGHWLTANTASVLGECLCRLERYAEAEPLLLESHTVLAKTLKTSDYRMVDATHRLVGLYEQWGRPEEAARWRSEFPAP